MSKIIKITIQVITVFILTVATGLIIKEYDNVLNGLNISDFMSINEFNQMKDSYYIRMYLILGLYYGILMVLFLLASKDTISPNKEKRYYLANIIVFFSVLALCFGLYYFSGINYINLFSSIRIIAIMYFGFSAFIYPLFIKKHLVKETDGFDKENLPTEYEAIGIQPEVLTFSSIYIFWLINVYLFFPDYWAWYSLLILIIPLTIVLSFLPNWSSKNQVIFSENEVILKKVFSTTKMIPYFEIGTIYRIEDLGGLKIEFFYKGKKHVIYSGYRNEQKQKIYMQLLKYTGKDNDSELEKT